MAGVIETPELELISSTKKDQEWGVIVYDNSVNTYEEVMTVLMIATNCSEGEAYIEAWEVDHFGKCVVHRSNETTCNAVAKIISTIGIKVEVSKGA